MPYDLNLTLTPTLTVPPRYIDSLQSLIAVYKMPLTMPGLRFGPIPPPITLVVPACMRIHMHTHIPTHIHIQYIYTYIHKTHRHTDTQTHKHTQYNLHTQTHNHTDTHAPHARTQGG